MIKNGIIIIGLLAIIAFGYYLFVFEDAAVRQNNVSATSQAQVEARAFLRRLEDLRSVQLSTDLLSDPRFTSRVDTSTEPPFIPSGRPNPFLPAE